jgi:hypothetical protein
MKIAGKWAVFAFSVFGGAAFAQTGDASRYPTRRDTRRGSPRARRSVRPARANHQSGRREVGESGEGHWYQSQLTSLGRKNLI